MMAPSLSLFIHDKLRYNCSKLQDLILVARKLC